jgi:arylsulfatase A-like enzyme
MLRQIPASSPVSALVSRSGSAWLRLLLVGVGALALLAVALAVGAHGNDGPGPPRSVLVILVDTLRADFVGAYGARWNTTPTIDALAAEGVTFDQAFAQASWTRPSVPTIFTGLYPSEHHLVDFVETKGKRETRGARLAAGAETVAERFAAAGWRTALTGFQFQLSPRFGLDQGFDFYASNVSGGAGAVIKRFLDWQAEAPGRPYFAYLHFLDLHWPYCPPNRLNGHFDPTPTAMDVCGRPGELKRVLEEKRIVPTAVERTALEARYAESLLAIDERLGDLFAELRHRGLWDEALVVVTSDHGQEFGEHGGYGHGTSLYDELLRVPFVWKLPRSWNEAHRRVLPPVELRSLAPTILEASGVEVPERMTAPSLLRHLRGDAGESDPFRFVAAESNGFFAVRDRTHKLIVEPATKRVELYDLIDDPLEVWNVASEEPVELERMRGYLREWRTGLRPLPAEADSTITLDAETESGLRSLGYLN